jgi:hypothetical protein
MKLSELFPDMPKVVIDGVEYEVKFGTRAVLQVENDYPTPDEVKNVLQTLLTGVKASDLINLLFAGLLNTKAFKDKDSLIDAIEPKDFTAYADAILAAYTQSVVNQEQLDKLEVLSLNAKKKADPETIQGNTPFIE